MSDSAINFILRHIDAVGVNLVANTYHQLVVNYRTLIYTLTTLYIGFVFIKMLRGHYDSNDFIMLILRAVIILTLALNYNYFCLFLYDVFTNEPLNICRAITINEGGIETTTIGNALDHFLTGGTAAVNHIFSMGSWSNPTYFIFGIIVFVLVILSTAIAAGLIVLAKCATMILFALSPLFIFFALFDATKGFFEAYLRQLFNYALIPIMTCAVLMILLSVANVATDTLNHHAQLTLSSLAPLSLIAIIQMYLLLQVKDKCASLVGGFSLPSVISAFRKVQNEWGGAAKNMAKMGSSAMRGMSQLGQRKSQMVMQRTDRFNK